MIPTVQEEKKSPPRFHFQSGQRAMKYLTCKKERRRRKRKVGQSYNPISRSQDFHIHKPSPQDGPWNAQWPPGLRHDLLYNQYSDRTPPSTAREEITKFENTFPFTKKRQYHELATSACPKVLKGVNTQCNKQHTRQTKVLSSPRF